MGSIGVIQVGSLFGKDGSNPMAGRIDSPCGIAPSLNTSAGGYRVPLIVEYEDQNQYNLRIYGNPQGVGIQLHKTDIKDTER